MGKEEDNISLVISIIALIVVLCNLRRTINRNRQWKKKKVCEYKNYTDLDYSSWYCEVAEGIVSQDFCENMCVFFKNIVRSENE